MEEPKSNQRGPATSDLLASLTSSTPSNPIRERTLNNIAALEAKLRARDPNTILHSQRRTLMDQFGQWEEVVKVLAAAPGMQGAAKEVTNDEKQQIIYQRLVQMVSPRK
jgi:hypothetical protein